MIHGAGIHQEYHLALAMEQVGVGIIIMDTILRIIRRISDLVICIIRILFIVLIGAISIITIAIGVTQWGLDIIPIIMIHGEGLTPIIMGITKVTIMVTTTTIIRITPTILLLARVQNRGQLISQELR
jgi:hypothetical protein